MADSYPLPRGKREDGPFTATGAALYGPFSFRIFDAEDAEALINIGGVWQAEPSARAEKLSAAPFDYFRLRFAQPPAAGTQIIVRGCRVAERSTDVTRGGTLIADALEQELSKIAVCLIELRRDAEKGNDYLGQMSEAIKRALAILAECRAAAADSAKQVDFAAQWAAAQPGKCVDDGRNAPDYSARAYAAAAAEQEAAANAAAKAAMRSAAAAQDAVFSAQEVAANAQSKLEEAAKGAFGFDPQKIYDEGLVTDEFDYFTRDEGKIADL